MVIPDRFMHLGRMLHRGGEFEDELFVREGAEDIGQQQRPIGIDKGKGIAKSRRGSDLIQEIDQNGAGRMARVVNTAVAFAVAVKKLITDDFFITGHDRLTCKVETVKHH